MLSRTPVNDDAVVTAADLMRMCGFPYNSSFYGTQASQCTIIDSRWHLYSGSEDCVIYNAAAFLHSTQPDKPQ